MNLTGFFITLEGVEGCGKTTQVQQLGEFLRQRGYTVLVTREPGGCPIADQIRKILLHPDNGDLVPRAELLLYAAARAQHVEEVIRPALATGHIVLCDRFTDATKAYQGAGRSLDFNLIDQLNHLATAGLQPQLTLLLDLPVEVALSRARSRNASWAQDEEGRFEAESLAFHQRVRNGYRTLAEQEPERILTIDAAGAAATVAQRISDAVTCKMAQGEQP